MAWRKLHIPPIVTTWTKNLLESGFMYIHGRDACFRPALILTPSRMDNLGIPKNELADAVIRCTSFVLEYMIGNNLLPGQIENWITIINVNKQGVMSVDKTALKTVIKVASDNYRSRPKKTIILNTTFSVNLLWKIVSPFLHAQTKAKISLTSGNAPDELHNLFHPSQVEEKFGGAAPDVEKFWPPIFP